MVAAYYSLPGGSVIALDGNTSFPPLETALKEPNGLIAIGGTLNTTQLVDAYRHGIFPWFSEGEPILWWSPDPRMVLFTDELKITASLKKTLKKKLFEIRFNTAFRAVISACSQTKRPGQNGTWINSEMLEAYCKLHEKGIALCAESWLGDTLVGGCYGIKIGRMFYGESMFHTHADASKVAFVHLVEMLKNQGVEMIDCQMRTPLLSSFGGREIPRQIFIQKLRALIG